MHLCRSGLRLAGLRILIVLALYIVTCAASSEYQERLHLKPLPGSSLLASFTFSSQSKQSSFDAQHFGFFPRSFGQILQHAHTKELHLRFNTGRWDADSWGQRPWNGTREGGTGVELWAWVEAQTEEEAQKHWLTLVNALSGLFCASLNFVDSTRTTRPVMTFERQGLHISSSPEADANLQLMHGTLPREVVCTENLTPFLKLLPCKGRAGISSLMDGHKVFDAAWQAMAIDVFPSRNAETGTMQVDMVQTIDMVLDIERSKRPRDDPIPRPLPLDNITCDTSKYYHAYGDTCFPMIGPQMPAFTLEEIFGRPLKGACSLTGEFTESVPSLCIDVDKSRKIDVLSTGAYSQVNEGDSTRCYKMPAELRFDLSVAAQQDAPVASDSRLLRAERTLTGSGQERGGLATVFTNPSSSSVQFVYFESLPWFTKLYLHTFTASLSSLSAGDHVPSDYEPIQQQYYQPAVDRSRPTHLELMIEMPPQSQLRIEYDIEKSILRYAEYPPDANRGFDIAPGIVHVLPSFSFGGGLDLSSTNSYYLRTTSLLLYLPTPDFSMPYNTIILSSTVIALGFGTIFNILVRRFVSADEAEALNEGTLKKRLGRALAEAKVRLTVRFQPSEAEKKQQ